MCCGYRPGSESAPGGTPGAPALSPSDSDLSPGHAQAVNTTLPSLQDHDRQGRYCLPLPSGPSLRRQTVGPRQRAGGTELAEEDTGSPHLLIYPSRTALMLCGQRLGALLSPLLQECIVCLHCLLSPSEPAPSPSHRLPFPTQLPRRLAWSYYLLFSRECSLIIPNHEGVYDSKCFPSGD